MSNFFKRIAMEVDFDKLKGSERAAQLRRDLEGKHPGKYVPMRRKLQVQ